jgi:hypothetical protein
MGITTRGGWWRTERSADVAWWAQGVERDTVTLERTCLISEILFADRET